MRCIAADYFIEWMCRDLFSFLSPGALVNFWFWLVNHFSVGIFAICKCWFSIHLGTVDEKLGSSQPCLQGPLGLAYT